MVEPKYKRILIKLSGEALAGERGVGIDIKTVQNMAQEIKEVHELGDWRGKPLARRTCCRSRDGSCPSRLHRDAWDCHERPCDG